MQFKKVLVGVVAASSLLYSSSAFAEENLEQPSLDEGEVIFWHPEVNLNSIDGKIDSSSINSEKSDTFKLDGKTFELPQADVNSSLKEDENESLDTSNEPIELQDQQTTQLLEMKKVDDDTYNALYVSDVSVEEISDEISDDANTEENTDDNILEPTSSSLFTRPAIHLLAAPSNGTEQSSWKYGVTGYVKVFYHVQYKDGIKHYDMNYVNVRWSAGSGSSVSSRSLTMGQQGSSAFAPGHVANNQKQTVSISKNITTTVNVKDSWYPVFKGTVGASSTAKVKKGSNSGTLKVDTRILIP